MQKELNVMSLIRPDLKNIKAYSSARDEFNTSEKMVFLDANESPFDTGINRYPDPYQAKLKDKISALKNISPQHILLGNGSDEIIDLIVRLFCKPFEDKVVTFPPTYGMYKVVADLNGVEVLTSNLNNTFQIDLDSLQVQLKASPKIIFICSPNNPSGSLIDRKTISHILKTFEGMVVIDEAYQDFSAEDSWASQLDSYPNLMVMQTFSKAWGMAGIRLGMCFAHPEIITYLNRIKPPYNINELTQNTAIECINNYKQVQKHIKIIIAEREKLVKKLKNISWIAEIYPSEANFILVKVDDALKRYEDLLSQKIVVRNRHNITGCENCLRISIGTPEENDVLIQTLNQMN